MIPHAFHRVIPHGEVSVQRVTSLAMKKILYLMGIVTLLSTTGCIFPGGGGGRGHEHARYEHHDDVIVGPPVLVVRPPEVIVR